MGCAFRLIIFLTTICVLVLVATSQPIDQAKRLEQYHRRLKSTVGESPLVYYPFKAFTEVAKDVVNDPQIRYPIPEFFPLNIIEAPTTCPPGQMIDHTGYCRDVWRATLQFSNLLNLNIS